MGRDYYDALRPILFRLPPELAHNIAAFMLQKGWVPTRPWLNDDALSLSVSGLAFRSPIGLAAGFDKNAAFFSTLYGHGFGFAEVGTLTPRPQSGNPKPRIFRLAEDRAIINRLGFNNKGVEAGLENVVRQERQRTAILGINIGKNKDTEEALDDYVPLLRRVYTLADYITVNISSPNTKDLRSLQERDQFHRFIKAIIQERNGIAAFYCFRRPVFVKIAPDMRADDLEALLDAAQSYQVDGLIVSNTTIARPESLQSQYASETGGLSGAPLTQRAEALMADIYAITKGTMPLIGVGGIMTAADAVRRIRAGATLVQLYSGLIYRGFGLVGDIQRALLEELKREGLNQVEQLIGIGN